MKIKEGYILREVAGNNIVVAVGNVDFNGMITLNDAGTLLWKVLEKGADEDSLTDVLLQSYDIDRETAAADAAAFVKRLKDADLVE